MVTVRQANGVQKAVAVSPYIFKVYSLVQQNRCAMLLGRILCLGGG